MKLRNFNELLIGSPFLFYDDVWIKTEPNKGKKLFEPTTCHFGVDFDTIFVLPITKKELSLFLTNEKVAESFLTKKDKEFLKICEIFNSIINLNGIIKESWIKESKERKVFFERFLKSVQPETSINNLTTYIGRRSINFINEWAENKRN